MTEDPTEKLVPYSALCAFVPPCEHIPMQLPAVLWAQPTCGSESARILAKCDYHPHPGECGYRAR